MSRRPVAVSLLLIVITMIAGIAIRFAHLGLPALIVKYGGSALWAMTIYWIASSFLSAWRVGPVVAIAGTIATAVEFFKLCHAPAVDAFRYTVAGVLLLGRIFSFRDIAAYWLAIAIAAALDAWLRRLHSIGK